VTSTASSCGSSLEYHISISRLSFWARLVDACHRRLTVLGQRRRMPSMASSPKKSRLAREGGNFSVDDTAGGRGNRGNNVDSGAAGWSWFSAVATALESLVAGVHGDNSQDGGSVASGYPHFRPIHADDWSTDDTSLMASLRGPRGGGNGWSRVAGSARCPSGYLRRAIMSGTESLRSPPRIQIRQDEGSLFKAACSGPDTQSSGNKAAPLQLPRGKAASIGSLVDVSASPAACSPPRVRRCWRAHVSARKERDIRRPKQPPHWHPPSCRPPSRT